MTSLTDQQLLRDFTENRSEAAFAELVRRHVDFVYSAALRMVCDSHLAQDVAQGVFLALAQNARQLADRPVLSGWLHRTAQNLAANIVRTDVRRRAREQEAAAMNELLATGTDVPWENIATHLDAALGELGESDRDALLLRYFERKSVRELAQTLGISEEAAQRRASRAVEKLREFLAKRGAAVGAGGLVVLISANAVQAAPASLAAAISTTALAGTVAVTSTAFTSTKIIAMTTLQKAIITVAFIAAVGTGIFEAHQNSRLRLQNEALQQAQAQFAARLQQLQTERDAATNQVAALAGELAAAKKNPVEVLKLRGEVGALKQENQMAGEKSVLSKITSDPATRNAMREQQKMGMKMLYGDLAKKLDLTPEMTGKMMDMMADNVMDNVDLITQVLHDGKSQAEVDQIFAAADATFQGKLQALLGDDALAQYKDYTQNLINTVSASQFADGLTGDAAAKKDKQNQFQQVMQEATATALKNAGLPPDYQVIPMLNFANIASADQADQSLNLLDSIYADAAAKSSSFLTPEELASLQTFRTNALNNNRMALTMNRKLMAPISQ